MKKSIALVAMAFGVTSAFAQDLTSKKGEPFLPEAGDYAIGIDAAPFLNYAGNFFGKTNSNTAPTWDYANTNMWIVGKKFKDANTAYRAGIRLGFGSDKRENLVQSEASGATATDRVSDTWKRSSTNIGVTVGLEKRRGKTRLQGVYGAEAALMIGTNKVTKEYGNEMTTTNSNPTSTTWNPDGSVATSGALTSRNTVTKDGFKFGFGVRAFVGAEYFVAPKISIGGEFGWGIGLTTTGQGTTSTQAVSGSAVTTTDEKTGKSSAFGLDTDKNNGVFGPSGTIRLNFHF